MKLQSHLRKCSAILALLAIPIACHADVKPSGIFASGAVLQRNAAVPVWGTAVDGESVTVSVNGQTAKTTASGGVWRVSLKSMPAGGPYTMTIAGPKNTVTLTNVYVGEVWLCSGQSNMGFGVASMANAAEIEASSTDPLLHVCLVGGQVSGTPKSDDNFTWSDCSKGIMPGFSAVGYVFGRELRKALGVPVGIVESAVGGTVAESWTSNDSLAEHPEFKYLLDSYAADQVKYSALLQDYNAKLPELQATYNAAKTKYDSDSAAMKAQYDAAVAAGTTAGTAAPPPPHYPTAPQPPSPPADPAGGTNYIGHLYNGMIAPVAPFAIKGAVWYQGESNVGRGDEYRVLLPTLIGSWRKSWGQGDFPFIIVQLPPIGGPIANPQQSAWSELREAQRLTAITGKNIGLAVLTDISDESVLHPTKKEPVGVRVALVARGLAYRNKGEYMGPVYDGTKIDRGNIIVHFKHAEGLYLAGDGKGFQVAGSDGKWQPAVASCKGTDVYVASPAVPAPTQVRLGWGDFPVIDLRNGAGLGAGPFQSDESLSVTKRVPTVAPTATPVAAAAK